MFSKFRLCVSPIVGRFKNTVLNKRNFNLLCSERISPLFEVSTAHAHIPNIRRYTMTTHDLQQKSKIKGFFFKEIQVLHLQTESNYVYGSFLDLISLTACKPSSWSKIVL